MTMNEYYMQLHVQTLLAEARAAAERRALAGPEPAIIGPAARAVLDGLRRLYGRWSSAASTGSKPTTARAWSRSR
jgi:hypothetical protein